MQVPILSGIYTDSGAPDFRISYPRNMRPVVKPTGISDGYLRPAEGIEQVGTGVGPDRGGINWNGTLYRVSGDYLVSVSEDGTCTSLGYVGPGGQASMDYSFDRLSVVSAGCLYYWGGSSLVKVTDPDLGYVIDGKWVAGYFVLTDGESVITTDLNDPTSINPLHYGSSESDPDPVKAVDELRNELYAFNRYTVEVLENIGGTGFPFQVNQSAKVGKGAIGTHAYCSIGDTFVFLGSGRNEAPSVYQMVPGNVQSISTSEIDRLLLDYTEDELSQAVMETRVDKRHQLVMIHLPDQCLVYDTIGSQMIGQPLWHVLTSSLVGLGQYRARGHVWCYDRWNVGDPTSDALGSLVDDVSTHYGSTNGWDFGCPLIYNKGSDAQVHELELVCLTGRVAIGADPVIWTQYSHDGQTWSQERSARAGRQGERSKRICWRTQGRTKHWRAQRFRGTSDAHLSIARLEAQIEPLFTKAFAGAVNG